MFGFGLNVDNVNEALPMGMQLVKDHGVLTMSRGLEVLRVPGPVMTIYRTPQRRVLFDSVRDANPFFHLMECLWILAGSNRVEFPCRFLANYAQYSDDGKTLHGAYGHRLRHEHGFDQIDEAVKVLREKPDTRQVVLSIWKPALDLGTTHKDIPCNDMIMLDIVDDALNMTVCNRSNDVIWGAYGANAVHFSFLQEWIAIRVGVKVGKYVQQSNNYHVYTNNSYWQAWNEAPLATFLSVDPYTHPDLHVYPVAIDALDADAVYADAVRMVRNVEERYHPLRGVLNAAPFTEDVVTPMIQMYDDYKNNYFDRALKAAENIAAPDWRLACYEWVARRAAKRAVKEAAQ